MIRSFQNITPKLAPGVYVDESAQVIGDVTLGEDASVWPLTVVRGDVNKITIGARTNIQDNCCLHVTHDGPYTPGGVELIIGEEVTVGHAVMLHACTIGDRCLIGMGAILLDRVVLEDECFVAAGSIVSPGKRLKGGWLYRGTPAVAVRELTEAERDNLRYSAAHYVRLKNKYLASA
ncbi:gamma carbonic anhydrase family protein [Stenotrophobium rhamnosiphilum]|uniref:Gamma carbonic anhydrase family protein n=1 Tax=Stenotrophobium rhamnosiphilum TaxID=2029166 RepID=A0A2T5MJD5_9GAMM|nr:gamma carbonic anhydrase family protein [Stenotrophobium rhamnosiphilum]PTU32668.1 gamma carbonic anhydrase family protein [Stenotrophobium rhamnosiphilum]